MMLELAYFAVGLFGAGRLWSTVTEDDHTAGTMWVLILTVLIWPAVLIFWLGWMSNPITRREARLERIEQEKRELARFERLLED